MVAAIAGIDEQSWVPTQHPNAIYDEAEERWISDAEVAEVGFTAFTGRRKTKHVTARLIVRRVRRLNPTSAPTGEQGESRHWGTGGLGAGKASHRIAGRSLA